MYSGGIDNVIYMYDVGEGRLEESISGHQDTVSCLSLGPDGTYLMSNSFD